MTVAVLIGTALVMGSTLSASAGVAAAPTATTADLAAAEITLDNVRYKSMFLRHQEALAQVEAERRAQLRAERKARKLARERAAKRKERREARQARKEARRLARLARPSGGLIVGDSVSLGAEQCLTPMGYWLDSEVGRQFPVGLQRLRAQAAKGLPDTVVIHLGTNGPFTLAGFQEAMSLVRDQDRVVWVTIALPEQPQYQFRDSVNQMIRQQAARYENVRLADFAAAAAQHPEWFYEDGVHINSAGCAGFAQIVNEAVTSPLS